MVMLRSPEGIDFEVDSGSLCVDFVYTGGAAERARWETLHTPDDLTNWIAARMRVPAAHVRLGPHDVAQAKGLREALWHSLNRCIDGSGPSPSDTAVIDAAAARPDIAPQLAAPGTVVPITGDQALSTLARDAVDLLGGPRASRIKRCAADDCPLVFVDTSRAGNRRWCSMARCGNRDKVRAHRRKEQA
ncbi:CGNR zinc finger domain-containing protein [Rhodococcus sp. NPDC003382]|uniref:CGNR zinc finger domain-containing protein n=1 Tax=Rhodococcus sp. CX TaxID=2789880 RepID=UPI0018CF5292|nr:CGNR zinc finger domain-containing protein [Rhodococcus sp. CX]MBH0123398.1 CGNR zinc finger domain-containing protein [Rhodococcus sp. CX]